MLDPNNLALVELNYALATFSNPLTPRITDYLNGYQLGARSDVLNFRVASNVSQPGASQSGSGDGLSTSYWVGPMVPSGHRRYIDMQNALVKSFNFRNVTLEGVEFLADGVGADEADWSLVSELNGGDETVPLPLAEQALLDEAEQLLTSWWDHRDVPSTLQHLLQSAIAHGHAPLRPRIPERYKDAGKLRKITDPLRSLEPLHLVLPDVALSGIYTDPESLEHIGVTQVLYRSSDEWKTEWEVTHVDSGGKTILTSLSMGGEQLGDTVASDPMDLGGRLWLFELRFSRGAVTRDVLSNQDALNVALTLLSRNTHFAGFAQIYGIGIDPPTTGGSESSVLSDGTVKPGSPEYAVPAGPGTQMYFQPSASTKITRTTGPNGVPIETIEETPYAGASYNKIDPADPRAIEVAIQTAEMNIYSALRQRFVMMDDKATASGRSREVATGSFLRATARYATATEHLIRELLEFALEISALFQGQPGKYRSLRAAVTLSQKVFDPSPLQVASDLALKQAGIISRQTLQGRIGVSDPAAEDARIAKEEAPEAPVKLQPAGDQTPATTN